MRTSPTPSRARRAASRPLASIPSSFVKTMRIRHALPGRGSKRSPRAGSGFYQNAAGTHANDASKNLQLDVGLFSPDTATKDIDVTWKLQKRYYDVRYEPEAIVRMRVPKGLKSFRKQRKRPRPKALCAKASRILCQ